MAQAKIMMQTAELLNKEKVGDRGIFYTEC